MNKVPNHDRDALGDRMKLYEDAYRFKLPRRMPVILRLDGRAFHTVTKNLPPFCSLFQDFMRQVTEHLCGEIQGAQFAYFQSDEISILVNNYKTHKTQPWFDNNLQKMTSIAAGEASSLFSTLTTLYTRDPPPRGVPAFMRRGSFDARAFVLPEADVANYFIWRQQDAIRNSIQMRAQSLFSQTALHKKNTNELKEMCRGAGFPWENLEGKWKNGSALSRVADANELLTNSFTITRERTERWLTLDDDCPLFTANRGIIEQHLGPDPEPEEAA